MSSLKTRQPLKYMRQSFNRIPVDNLQYWKQSSIYAVMHWWVKPQIPTCNLVRMQWRHIEVMPMVKWPCSSGIKQWIKRDNMQKNIDIRYYYALLIAYLERWIYVRCEHFFLFSRYPWLRRRKKEFLGIHR